MIEISYRGRLGNQLFQYCFGRLLAEELGWKLQSPRCEIHLLFVDVPEVLGGQEYNEPLQEVSDYGKDGRIIDLADILADKTPRKIRLQGFFQRWSIYKAYEKRIKGWFPPLECENKHGITKNDVLVQVRLGDYVVGNKWGLTFDYYERALEMAKPRRVFLTSDEPEHPFLANFDKFRAINISGGRNHDFIIAQLFDKIVMSMSSFCWWAAFFSQASKIWCPWVKGGLWGGGFKEVDLIIPERFTLLEATTWGEEKRQA